MGPFAPRPRANVEYWFWKFHIGDLAFLVDVIIRRRTGQGEVRVSQWLRGSNRVIHDVSSDWSGGVAEVRVGGTTLTPNGCVGRAGDVAWNLTWTPGRPVYMLPGLLRRLAVFDTTLCVWPAARFDGWVSVGDERFDLTELAGTFYHYWGRRLADRWVWLSATDFEGEPGRRVEGLIAARTRMYGRVPYPLPASWLWTTDGANAHAIVSGVNGIITARVTAAGISATARSMRGRRHHLEARWGEAEPNDIGEGIVQTMHADLTIDGVRARPGSVGLEVRGYPHPVAAGEPN